MCIFNCSWRSWTSQSRWRSRVVQTPPRCTRLCAVHSVMPVVTPRPHSQRLFPSVVSHASRLPHSSTPCWCWRNSTYLTSHRRSHLPIFPSAAVPTSTPRPELQWFMTSACLGYQFASLGIPTRPEKSWIFSSGPGKSWKISLVLESPGN